MICYFPLTHITDSHVKLLAEVLGPVTVNLPAGSMVTQQVDAWAQAGLLELKTPSGLDESSLLRAVQEFKNWADMHGRKLSDIAEFYRQSQGHPPMMDENAPSQISTQIKHFNAAETPESPNRLYQSALFMALAHEYDLHQEAAAAQLGSVVAMEADLFAKISGDAEDAAIGSPVRPSTTDTTAPYVPGIHMGARRLQTWACLAEQDAVADCTYVTTSSEIFGLLLERFPENREILCWHLSDNDRHASIKQQRRSALDELARANEPLAILTEAQLDGRADSVSVKLKLHLLPGVSPRTLLNTFSKREKQTLTQATNDTPWQNSIVGIITS